MVNSIANQLPADVVFEKQLGQLAAWYRLMRQEGLHVNDALQMDIDDKEMRKRHVRFWNSGGYEPSTEQRIAKAILGDGNFFGPAELLEHFGDKVKFTKAQLAKVSQIPWSEEELKNPKINQPHFLFLGVERFDGKPLNLPRWHEIYPDKEIHPKFALDWYLSDEQAFRLKTCRLRGISCQYVFAEH